MKATAAVDTSPRRAIAARGAPAAPRLAERVVHAPGATTGQAIGAVLESALRQIDDNARAWQASADPEALHQLRVGIRRLRATLSVAKRVLPPQSSPLNRELSAIAQALGAARDVDVFVEETLPSVHAAATPRTRRAIDALRLAAERRRAAARRAARAMLTATHVARVTTLVAALASACASGGDALDAPAREFARAVLKRRHRRLVERLRDVATLEVEERHALRIATKKLRYATEGFGSFFPASRVGRYRRALAGLQGTLGAMNDAAVAVALADELAASSAARNAVRDWADARHAELHDDLDRAARRFPDVRRFWTRD